MNFPNSDLDKIHIMLLVKNKTVKQILSEKCLGSMTTRENHTDILTELKMSFMCLPLLV